MDRTGSAAPPRDAREAQTARTGRALRRVEEALRAHPGVRDIAVVTDRRSLAPRVLAYVVTAQDHPPRVDDLRDRLRADDVSTYPVEFVGVPILPRTGSDVRRELLPQPHVPDGHADPADPTRIQVEAVWQRVLDLPVNGARNFFDAGGNSFRAARAVAGVRSALGVDIPLEAIYENPTMDRFVSAVRRATPGGARATMVRLREGTEDQIVFTPNLYGDARHGYTLLPHLPQRLTVDGLQIGTGADAPTRLHDAVERFATALRRTMRPGGRCVVAGYGPAAPIAVHLARRLRAEGLPVFPVLVAAPAGGPAVHRGMAAGPLAGEVAGRYLRRMRAAEYAPLPLGRFLRYLDAATSLAGGAAAVPAPVRVLHALVAQDRRPGLDAFRDLSVDAQLDLVVSSWGDGPDGELARRTLHTVRAVIDLLDGDRTAAADEAPVHRWPPDGYRPDEASSPAFLDGAPFGDHANHLLAEELTACLAAAQPLPAAHTGANGYPSGGPL